MARPQARPFNTLHQHRTKHKHKHKRKQKQGWQGPAKAGLISGGLSALGDLLAQLLARRHAESSGRAAPEYDPLRTLRMLGFGLLWYGPYQFYWYALLDWAMPARSTQNFIAKVALNQLALAPVVLAVVFSWNLALTGAGAEIPGKIRRDLVPAMVNGWKFWVPAASVNFYCVPLDKQGARACARARPLLCVVCVCCAGWLPHGEGQRRAGQGQQGGTVATWPRHPCSFTLLSPPTTTTATTQSPPP